MSLEFDVARSSFASSAPGRAMRSVTQGVAAAWRSSSIRSAIDRTHMQLALTPSDRVRIVAVAVAVGTMVQAGLALLMPVTVKPLALPVFDVALTTLAAAVAWRADAIVATWPTSQLARMLKL